MSIQLLPTLPDLKMKTRVRGIGAPVPVGVVSPSCLPALPSLSSSRLLVVGGCHTPSATSLGHLVVTYISVNGGMVDQPDLCAWD